MPSYIDILLDQVTTHLMVDAADILLTDPLQKRWNISRERVPNHAAKYSFAYGEGFAGIAVSAPCGSYR
jgi:hypothetical protein